MPDSETFEINLRLALLAIDDLDRKSEVSAGLQELGYRIHVAASLDDARERLRKNSYEVIVLDARFQRGTRTGNALLQHLDTLHISVRRNMFVALLAADVKTLDNMTAFAHSVNATIDYADLAHVKAILERAIADNDAFYRVMRQALAELGKQ
jgi:CheY-like chemotaxis protein